MDMSLNIRFLLTGNCTARCAYCHNEGQSQKTRRLKLASIRQFLKNLIDQGTVLNEIVLSGGEPTLHKEVGEIARLCKTTGAFVSMNSHGGHPKLLKAALPYLDELKLHIDSFDAQKQYASMGIDIAAVEESLMLAREYPTLRLMCNHPLNDVQETCAFLERARMFNLDCKIIEVFGQGHGCTLLPCVHWAHLGYRQLEAGIWEHESKQHRIFTKRCGHDANLHQKTLFVGADGIREALDGPVIGQLVDSFTSLS
jgi:hypothetical protein